MRRTLVVLAFVSFGCVAAARGLSVPLHERQPAMVYRVESMANDGSDLDLRFSAAQLRVLEKLNRADRDHLGRLPELVVPERWLADELEYSVMPLRYPAGASYPKILIVHLPSQMFGAYVSGTLVRWGPLSSGGRATPTPIRQFFLNWRSRGHTSTVDSEWFLRWYFNFGNREGLAFHEYSLPGEPASHGCLRLLGRDARWLYDWGDEWIVDASGAQVLRPGTPVLIVGSYDFDMPPPWRSLEWLANVVELPPIPAS